MARVPRRALLGCVVVALGAGLVAPPAGATASEPRPALRRLLVFSLPQVTWADLSGAHVPTLDALSAGSGVADLAVRSVNRRATPDEDYVTMGAGTRAEPTPDTAPVLGPDEPFEGGRALDAYVRRTGRSPGSAAALVLGLADLRAHNASLYFDARMGALGTALRDAGVGRAVIANADQTRFGRRSLDYVRPAALALMDDRGVVPEGRVDRGLLVPDPAGPFGLRLDADAVLGAFRAAWHDRTVVLVEASDLARADAYGPLVSSALRDDMKRRALEAADALLARLLAGVDPSRDGVVVMAPGAPSGESAVTVLAVRAPGMRPSLLRTATTRRSGFVTIEDVGAGVAALMGVEPPASMEGRPLEAGARGGGATQRRDFLVRSAQAAKFRDHAVGGVVLAYVLTQLVLAGMALFLLHSDRRGGRRAVAWGALVMLGVLPMTYLATLVDFYRAGAWAYAGFVVGGSTVLATAAWVVGRRDPLSSVGALLATILGVHVASTIALGSRLSFNAVFGDSAIVGFRFTGVGNLTFAQLMVAAIVLAAMIHHRFGGRKGLVLAGGLLGLVLLTDGLPAWGADVGGALAAVPAFAYVWARLAGVRVRPRTLALFLAAGVAVVGVFLAFDLSRPPDQHTHLARLFEQTDARGMGAFMTVLWRKAAENVGVVGHSVWTLAVVPLLAFIAYLVGRRPKIVRATEARLPELGIALAGLAVVGVLGFALNDSGIAIPGMMLAVISPVLVHLSLRGT